MFSSYFNESILGRAQKESKIKINIYDLRDYADQNDKRRKVDDTPCGGGPGMVMMVEPIFRCVEKIKSEIKKSNVNKKILILLTSAKGEIYNQQKAEKIKNDYTDVIIICGRYEGVDERVAEFIADEEISIGRYILTGGELPAMIIVDSVTRLLENVLGNKKSLESESYNSLDKDNLGDREDRGSMVNRANKEGEKDMESRGNNFDYPVYTRPIKFNGWEVPDILLSGNHKKIEEWREEKK